MITLYDSAATKIPDLPAPQLSEQVLLRAEEKGKKRKGTSGGKKVSKKNKGSM